MCPRDNTNSFELLKLLVVEYFNLINQALKRRKNSFIFIEHLYTNADLWIVSNLSVMLKKSPYRNSGKLVPFLVAATRHKRALNGMCIHNEYMNHYVIMNIMSHVDLHT